VNWSQIATLNPPFFGGESKDKIVGETVPVPFHLLVQALGRDTIEAREIRITDVMESGSPWSGPFAASVADFLRAMSWLIIVFASSSAGSMKK
jgi:hypothetical protein